jgi:hypothetical protein
MARADRLRWAIVSLALSGLAACATPSSPDQMVIDAAASAPAPAGAKGYHDLRLGGVEGGADTSVIGLSEVSNEALRAALTRSLRNLQYLSEDPTKAGYVVWVDIVDLDRPIVALDPVAVFVPVDLSVTVRVHYTVTAVATGKTVFDDTVATTGTGSAGDAMTPAGRVRRANEAAMRLNTAEFLKRLQANWK